MFALLRETNFNFMKYGRRVMALSAGLVVLSIVFIAVHGLNYGVEFVGGTELQLQFRDRPDISAVRNQVAAVGGGGSVVTTIGPVENHEVYIKVAGDGQAGDEDLTRRITDALRAGSLESGREDINVTDLDTLERLLLGAPGIGGDEAKTLAREIVARRDAVEVLGSVDDLAGTPSLTPELHDFLRERTYAGPVVVRSQSYMGPAIGRELLRNAGMAIIGSLLGMLVYIWIRFKLEWGLGAVVALLHDVTITLALFTLLDLEVTLSVVAAFLTLVGYSVNDTVVIYDRIRENLRAKPAADLTQTINLAVNQTLSRTIITSGLTFLVVFVLLLFGGGGLQSFAFVLAVGIIVGSYSTIFVASPFIVVWKAWLASRAASRAGGEAAAGTKGAETMERGERRARKIRAGE